MFYVGIDIAKNSHEASIIDSNGKLVSKSFSFSNSVKGLEKFKRIVSSFSLPIFKAESSLEKSSSEIIKLPVFFFTVLVNSCPKNFSPLGTFTSSVSLVIITSILLGILFS